MNCLKSRLSTFDEWPRNSPTAIALAEAGFYYSGDSSDLDDDTVTCFCCEKELSGWEDGDDPLNEHLAHPKTKAGCAWALLMSEKRKPTIPPTHLTLVKAREATFKGWPHEKERGWVGKAKKMAKAGLHFAPSIESEDAVECIYCQLGLDGWEPKDDPLAEHERRAKELNCPFFNGIPVTGGASSIFAMTKDVFAAERNAKEPSTTPLEVEPESPQPAKVRGRQSTIAPAPVAEVADKVVEKKKSTKRKLPGARAKKNLDLDDSIEIVESVQEPIPIVLKSARKKRTSTRISNYREESPSQQAPAKKSRLRRARSGSVSSLQNYAEENSSPAPEQPQRRLSRARAQRTRAPLQDMSDSTHNAELAEQAVVHSIKEEEEDEQDDIDSKQLTRTFRASKRISGQPQADKENSIRNTKPRTKRTSAMQAKRSTRSSTANSVVDIVEEESGNDVLMIDSADLKSQLPSSIEEEEGENEVTRTDSFVSAETDLPSNTRLTDNEFLREVMVTASSVSGHREETHRGSAVARTSGSDPESHISAEATTSQAGSRGRASSANHETSESMDRIGRATTQRRTSSRRRPSNSNTSDYIEDIVMLDHKAKPRLQRHIRKAAVLTSEPSIDSVPRNGIIEEEAEEAVEEDLVGKPSSVLEPKMQTVSTSTNDSAIIPPNVIELADRTSVTEMVAQETDALSPEERQIVRAQSDLSVSQPVSLSEDAIIKEQALVLRSEDLFEADEDISDKPHWYASFLDLYKTTHQAFKKEVVDFSTLPDSEAAMTVEEFLRLKAAEEIAELERCCHQMISRLEEAGHEARSAILAV